MATPAAVLSIIVEAQTGKAQAALKKFESDLKKVDHEKADATLGAEVEKGGFDLHAAMVKSADVARGDAEIGADVVTSDFVKAHAEVSALDAREVNIDIDFEKGVLTHLKTIADQVTLLGDAAGGAGDDVGGFGLKLGALGGSLGKMGPLLIAVAVAAAAAGAAIAALAASAGAAMAGLGALSIGALGAMTVGFGGVAAIAAPAIGALTELMGAQEAAEKAQKTGAASSAATAASSAQSIKAAHDQVADSTRGVTAAEQQLAMAQRSVQIAQESLTQARFEATRQLQDMRRAAITGETSEKRARLSVAQAEANLHQVMRDATAGRLDIRDAELSVTEARQNLTDVTIAGNRAEQDWNKAQKGGVSQMPGVVSAQQSLHDALRGVKSAQVGVADAHRGVSRALDNLAHQQRQANAAMGAGGTQMAALALAAKEAGPAAVAFSHQIDKLGDRWKSLTKGGQADFFGMLSDGVDRLQNKLPLLAKSANKSMGALRRGFDAFLDRATGGEFRKFVNVMTRTFSKSIGPFSKAFGNIAKVLQRIAVAVAPFVIDMAKAFERITKGWLQGTKDGKKLRETIGGLLSHLGAWLKLGAEIGKVFLNLFKALAGDGKGLVEWLTKGAKALNEWLTSAKGKEQIREFMELAIPLFKELAKLSFILLKVFLLLFSAVAIILTPALKVLNDVLGWILSRDGSGLEKMGGLFKWVGNAARNTADWIKQAWADLGDILGKPFRDAWRDIENGFQWLKNAAGNTVNWVKDAWGKLGHILGAPFRWGWQAIKDVIAKVREWVASAVQFIKDKWGDLRHILTGPFRAASSFIRDKVADVRGWLGGVIDWARDKWDKLGDILKKPFRGIAGWVSGVFNKIKATIIGVVNDLISAFNKLPGPDIGLIGQEATIKSSRTDKGFTFGRRGLETRGGRRVGGQFGGLVTAQGIIPQGFQRGGMVGKRGLKPGPKDTIPAMLEVGELVIPKEMVDKTKKNAKLTAAAMTGELGKGHKEASKDTEKFVKNHGKAWDRLRSTTSKTTERFRKGTVDDFQKTSKAGEQTTDKMRQRVSDGFSKMRGNAVETSGKMKQGVSEDFRELTGAVGDGLRKIGQMTNNALRALGVKKVNFSIGVKGKQRGGLIPGTGDGDKVPVMAEPGEGFINKKAVQALGGKAAIDKINKATPRFAKGGIVAAGKLAQTMGLTPSEHPAYGGVGGGHTGGSYHYKNQAIDVSGGDMRRYFGAVANRWMGHGLAELFYDPMGRYVKNDSWVQGAIGDHMDHVHVAITSAFGGAMVKKLKRVLLKGPDGPMTDMGQASLDKVRKAADSYIQKKMPTEGMEGAIMGSGDVERMFARVAKKLSTSKTATLALGEAGFAESGMRDLAYGDSTSQGALQLLSSTAAGMGLDPHDEGAIASAFLLRGFYGRGGANKLAAQGLPAHLVAQGVQGSAFASGSNYAAQAANAKSWMRRFGLREGGVVPGFQRGGVLRIPRFDKGGAVMQSGLREASKSPVDRKDRAAHAVAHRVGKAVASVSDVALKRGDREGDKAVNKKATQVAKPVLEDRKVLGVVDRTGVQHLARGGMVAAPFVGSFDKGGEVAKTGLGMLHKGERVEPPEHGRGSPFRQYHVMIKRLAKHIERVQRRLEEVREQKRPQWQRREMRLERRIEHTRGETGEQRQLVEELKELRKDIREHNHLYRTVRRSDKQALAAIVDLTSAQIGAQGQQKSRLAGWGVDRRY